LVAAALGDIAQAKGLKKVGVEKVKNLIGKAPISKNVHKGIETTRINAHGRY
jgi:hypothetical protein